MDLTKTGYTINEITDDGNILVTFECDGTQHSISGTEPLTKNTTDENGKSTTIDRASLLQLEKTEFKQRLDNYCLAYINGLKQVQVNISADVTSLIGKKQTAESE